MDTARVAATKSKDIVMGIPADTSLLPFRREVQRSEGTVGIEIFEQVLGVKKAFERQQVTLALLPPSQLLKISQMEMAMPLGLVTKAGSNLCYIGFREEQLPWRDLIVARLLDIKSIFCAHSLLESESLSPAVDKLWQQCESQSALRKFEGQKPVFLSSQCTTGHVLARIFYRMIFGTDALRTLDQRVSVADESRLLTVLDGQEALTRRRQFAGIIDLSEWWSELTGLPLVLYVWQKFQRQLPLAKQTRFVKLAERAEARMRVEPFHYYPESMADRSGYSEADYAKLWRDVAFRLGHSEMRSLLTWLYFAQSLEYNSQRDDAVTERMIRWQQREFSLEF